MLLDNNLVANYAAFEPPALLETWNVRKLTETRSSCENDIAHSFFVGSLYFCEDFAIACQKRSQESGRLEQPTG
jgi:hypothetical protein